MEMLLTGDLIDAARALEWGLVNRVVPPQGLDAAVAELAGRIAAKPAATISAGKTAFYRQMDMGVAEAYALSGGVIAASFSHPEGREGMDAFIGKRAPDWKR